MRPVVLIPGIGGSILVKRGQEYKTMLGQRVLDNRWMNITPFSKDSLERWRHDMNIDVVRRDSRVVDFTNYDADIYPYDVGGIRGITDIVPEFGLLSNYYSELLHRHFHFRYFGPLCDSLMAQHYVPKESLFGIPYDPRRLLEESYRASYFQQLKDILENCRRPAVVVAHSLGGVLLKWFLSEYVSMDWIQKHIGRLMIVNAPFGGTTMALRVILSGEYYVPMFHQEFKVALQKMPGILMCLPNRYAYRLDETLVKIDQPLRMIRVKDIVCNTGVLEGADALRESFDIWRDLYAPYLPTVMKPLNLYGIPCQLVFGAAQPTVKRIKLKREGELPYETQNEWGDSQVPSRSLHLAKDIFLGDHVRSLVIPETNHIDILSHPLFLQMVSERKKL